MRFFKDTITIKTKERLEIIDLTKDIQSILEESKIQEGLIHIYSKHTTMAIKINENEPLLLKDIKLFLEKIIPKEDNYNHDMTHLRKDCPLEEPKNADGHLKCMFLETSQSIPVINKKLALGKWQSILAIETSGAREREIIVQVIGE